MARKKVNELETLVQALADSLVASVEAFPTAPVPFGQVPVSQAEQVARYREVRDDPDAWTGMIKERGHRETLRYARTMERQHRRMMEAPNGRTVERGDRGQSAEPDYGVDRQPVQ